MSIWLHGVNLKLPRFRSYMCWDENGCHLHSANICYLCCLRWLINLVYELFLTLFDNLSLNFWFWVVGAWIEYHSTFALLLLLLLFRFYPFVFPLQCFSLLRAPPLSILQGGSHVHARGSSVYNAYRHITVINLLF